MMTGTRTMRVSRGRYVSAGYAEKRERPAADERELYISADPAGSARENLRDLNRAGYRSERPWRDTPDPALQKAAPETQRRAPARKTAARKQLGPIDRLLAEIRRDRKGVAVCAMLAATMLVMAAAWGRNMVSGVNTQRSIERYQAQTITLRQENEKLAPEAASASAIWRRTNWACCGASARKPKRSTFRRRIKRRGKRYRQSVRRTWKSSISCWVCSMCFILESERACVHREPPYESG